MGLGLTVQNFKNVLKNPRAIGVGLVCQIIGLPLIGFMVVKVTGLESNLAIGKN